MATNEEVAFSSILQEVCTYIELDMPPGFDKEIKKLSESIKKTSSSLKLAEAKHSKHGDIGRLHQLRDTVYDINDILRSSFLKGKGNKNQKTNLKVAAELKASRIRLDRILKELHLPSCLEPSNEHLMITKMEISRSPIETLVLLRSNEYHRQIVELLLSGEGAKLAGPCIIPVGFRGGTSTTELARAVFDDYKVSNYFSRRIWFDAPDYIKGGKLSKMFRGPASTIFWVHKIKNKRLEDEHVLIVFDDIKTIMKKRRWTEELKKPWLHVKTKERREIVLTTAQLGDNPFSHLNNCPDSYEDFLHCVERLSIKDSWILFEGLAFAGGDGNVDPRLESIGRNIVDSTGGCRLMIEMLGNILAASEKLSYWKAVLESQVWKLPVDEELVQPVLAGVCYRPYRWCSSPQMHKKNVRMFDYLIKELKNM